MWFQYFLVFLGSFLFDVVPIPFPPAFTIMVTLQVIYDLNIWAVIFIGVAGSIFGRYVLTIYIPYLAGKIFKKSKTDDIEFLGNAIKDKGWKTHLFILAYSLMPLPTTPLFLAAGIAKVKPLSIIPAFFVGKFISDSITVHLGKYATDNLNVIFQDFLSWKSITSLSIAVGMIGALLFINWRSLIQNRKLEFNFKIWK